MTDTIYQTKNLTPNQQKWLKHYRVLCERGQQRASTRTEANQLLSVVEYHHITPRCLGGSDLLTNLVYLSAEEHFIAHLLLTKLFPKHKGLHAACLRMAKNCPSNKVIALNTVRGVINRERKILINQYE